MALISCFHAKLECQKCKKITPNDVSICNSLIDNGYSYDLRVGDKVPDLVVGDFTDEYLTINMPDGNLINVLEDWQCPICNSWEWAKLFFNKDILEEIKSVVLNKQVLDEINFITYRVDQPFEWIVGKPMYEDEKIKDNFIKILKEHLTD